MSSTRRRTAAAAYDTPQTPERVLACLARRGLLTPEAIARGDVAVTGVARRNDNSRVVQQGGPSYFVKCDADAPDPALGREARVYGRLAAVGPVARYLASSFGYDARERLLILGLVDGQDLEAYHARLGRFPTGLARQMGRALAALHGRTGLEGGGVGVSSAPEALSVHRPTLERLPDLSAGAVELIKTVQRYPEFGALFDRLRADWRPGCFIHADLRWDNWLIVRNATAERLRIVDWELAGPGDPAWDVACIFANYLRSWVLSLPAAPDLAPDDLAAQARHPLARMQPAMRAFWEAYCRASGVEGAPAGLLLVRTATYLVARLVEIAYARSQGSLQPPRHAMLLVQLALNVLRRPQEAAVTLLGVPLPNETIAWPATASS